MKNLQDVFAAPTFQINIFVQLFQLIIRFFSLHLSSSAQNYARFLRYLRLMVYGLGTRCSSAWEFSAPEGGEPKELGGNSSRDRVFFLGRQ